MDLLPPRYWPTMLWVCAVAVGLLTLHTVALAAHFVVVLAGGGPTDSYGTHVLVGFIPGLVILVVGLVVAFGAARERDDRIVAWGRVFLVGLGVLAVALLGLGLYAGTRP